jgi:nanoRNase/pAp phosphatase (c-di-AMP/oligoRNAs hydrolase)
MTTFVDACLTTTTHSAAQVERGERLRARPKCARLLKALAGKRNILITSHLNPDPDALASCQAMQFLLRKLLSDNKPDSKSDIKITIRFKGQIGGGINSAFTRIIKLDFQPWDDQALSTYDAIVLMDTQPTFSNSPLPPGVVPSVVVDHHRGRGRRTQFAYSDIRIDVGATASIVFSYFMEQHVAIPGDLGAAMLYAVESDLAGAAGQQGGLDTIAISQLVLLADTRRLYQMRYVDLPQSYYADFAHAIAHATRHGEVIISHAGDVAFAEVPGVLADFLLRCAGVHWALVTAVHEGRFVFSLRTQSTHKSAGEVARRITSGIGDGGGHFTKAGGALALTSHDATLIESHRKMLHRRLLRCLHVKIGRGTKLA